MKLVLYHTHCQDGFFSAYLAWKQFGYKDTLYVPITHRPVLDMEPMEALEYTLFNTELSNEKYKDTELYIFDFCFPSSFLEVYKNVFKSIFVLDHHKSVFDDLSSNYKHKINSKGWYEFQVADNVNICFTSEECAAKIVYRHLYPELNVPWYIELISDRDLGKRHFEQTDMFYHGLTLYKPYKFEDMNRLVETDFQDITELGELIQRNRLDTIKTICENIIPIICEHEHKNYKGAMVNTDLSNASDVGNYILLCLGEYDFCVVFNVIDNKTAHCSIRATHGFNSLLISEKFNGGGNKISGGFGISLSELCLILNNNKLSI